MARKRRLPDSKERFGRALARVLDGREEYTTASGTVAWARFARELDFNYETLRQAVSGQRQPSIALMEAVADTLDIGPGYFAEYRLARLREALDPQKRGLERALENYYDLRPDER